jgi:hypothetical protein
MKIYVDIDGTICFTNGSDYPNSSPFHTRIDKINSLYEQGHHIVYWTARGGNSGIDWTELTTKQLNEWGCKYHELLMNKPSYDLYIDDKSINSEEYFI